MTFPVIGCCDLGGTKLLVGLTSLEGQMLATEKYLLGDLISPQAFIEMLDATLNRLLTRINLDRADLVALGCCTAGVSDFESGFIHMNHNIGWVNTPLRTMLTEQFGLPVALEMDANAAVLGEHWCGAAQQSDHCIYIVLGTGIGAGILLNGQIWRGARGVAGEIGHTVLIPDGPLCGCGKHGCLEALASGIAIRRYAESAVKLGQVTALKDLDDQGEELNAERVVELARAGDAVAYQLIDKAGYYLGLGIANLITLLDPQKIIIGGGFGYGAYDVLAPAIQRGLNQHLNYWTDHSIPITPSALGHQAGLYGAAHAALKLIRQSSHIH